MKHIVFDARMIALSGIGRYIQIILPLLHSLDDCKLTYLGDVKSIKQFFPEVDEKQIITINTTIYKPWEHLELKSKIPPCDLYFAPHYVTPFVNIPAKKRITVIHDLFHLWDKSHFKGLKKRYAFELIKNALKKSDYVVTISHFQKMEIHRHFPQYVDKVKVIHQSLKPNTFIPLDKKVKMLDDPYILFVGNIKPHKNLIRLINAFEQDAIDSLKLVIIGTEKGFYSPEEDLNNHIENDDNVICLGHVDDSELARWYAGAEFLVHPSYYEGFGMPPLEAMAMGTPSLVSDIPIMREIYKDTAAYFDPYDVESIKEGIKDLYYSKSKRRQLLKNRKDFLEYYHVDRMFNEYKKILNEV